MVGVAQLVRASGCGPEGRGFDSHRSPQKRKSVCLKDKRFFFSDAFLAERDAHFVRDADLRSVMHAFGAWAERIASPITAQLHHLSLVYK